MCRVQTCVDCFKKGRGCSFPRFFIGLSVPIDSGFRWIHEGGTTRVPIPYPHKIFMESMVLPMVLSHVIQSQKKKKKQRNETMFFRKFSK